MAAIDYSCMYTIIGPDGATVSFNNDDDPNFCGYLDTITGLDCAEVRENAQNKVAASGGLHDNFYAGRLPWSFSGTIQPSILTNAVQELIQQAVNKSLQADGQLLWTPTGETIERYVPFRCQQPTRMSGKVPKTFQIQGVGADYRIWSAAINSVGPVAGQSPISVTVTNEGNEVADVRFVIGGPLNANRLLIVNETTGKQVQFLPGVIGSPSGDGVPVQSARTGPSPYPFGTMFIATNYVTFNDFNEYNVFLSTSAGNTDQYSYVDPLNTDWSIAVAPGENTFTLYADGTTDATSLEVQWRHSWI